MKTREMIEAQASESKPENTAENTPPRRKSNAEYIKPWRWKPGQSGNPGGRPKQDLRKIIARAVFENNAEAIYKAYTKLLMKGSAFGYQVVGDAGYGKLKESKDTGSDIPDVPNDKIQDEIDSILARLGLARAIDAATEAGISTARTEKANGKAENKDILPR